MNDDRSNEDQRLDDELRRRLGSAPGHTDAGRELDRLRPRFARARQRRQVAVGAMGVIAVGAVFAGLALSGGGGSTRVSVEGDDGAGRGASSTSSSSIAPTSAVPTTEASLPATTTSAVPSPTSAPTTTPPPTPTTSAMPTPGRPPTSAVTTSTVPPAPVGGTDVLRSDGGTATVTWTATSLVVDTTEPATGWQLESVERKDATRVVVKFRRDGGGSGSSTASIDARVEDGRLRSN